MAATKKDKKAPVIGIDLSFLLKGLAKDKAAAVLAAFRAQRPGISDEDNMQNALNESVAKWARNYSQTTRNALKLALGNEMAQPRGIDSRVLIATIDKIPEIHAVNSAEMLVKTLTNAVISTANKAVWQQNGVETMEWYCGPTPCKECAALKGKVVNTGDSFFEDDRGDGSAPPRHENCDCYLRPGP